jgi:MOSC domain-containing protein YiiM
MTAKILSLNIGQPAPMEWQGKSIVSSMLKHPVPGPLKVELDHIEGNTFSSPQFHGMIANVLYAYGMTSALEFMKLLGRDRYLPGSAGETLTLDHFDEREVGVGDVFSIGEVEVQATFPRIPCGKVNFRMRHPGGQKAMQDCGLPGVYFRILKPGKIHLIDTVRRIREATPRLTIAQVYPWIVQKRKLQGEELALVKANGGLPAHVLERLV